MRNEGMLPIVLPIVYRFTFLRPALYCPSAEYQCHGDFSSFSFFNEQLCQILFTFSYLEVVSDGLLGRCKPVETNAEQLTNNNKVNHQIIFASCIDQPPIKFTITA
jgi:hypothetical protein